MKKRVWLSLVIGLVLIGLTIVVLMVSMGNDKARTAVIVVGTSGGLCPSEPCGGDRGAVYDDGSYIVQDMIRRISSTDMDTIYRLVEKFNKADYSAKGGDCGSSVVDGSDPYLKFPQKYGDVAFEPCGIPDSANMNPIEQIIEVLEKYA